MNFPSWIIEIVFTYKKKLTDALKSFWSSTIGAKFNATQKVSLIQFVRQQRSNYF